ncbi:MULTISPECIES: putative holin-like toxin [Leuconostoc]
MSIMDVLQIMLGVGMFIIALLMLSLAIAMINGKKIVNFGIRDHYISG